MKKLARLEAVALVAAIVLGATLLWRSASDAAAQSSRAAAAQALHLARLKAQDTALVAGLRGTLVRRLLPPSKFLRGKRDAAWIYLPPGYDAAVTRRYPVVYLLHGAPGSVRQPFVDGGVHRVAESLIERHEIAPLILVGFDGYGPGGFTDATGYLDRADGTWGMESFVTRELVPWVDANFRTRARAQSRALVGFSAGGYGAANLGFKHPELFRIIASHAGFFDPGDEPGLMTYMLGAKGPLWTLNSPLERAKTLDKRSGLHFYMDVGKDDRFIGEFSKMKEVLRKRGIDFVAQVVDGGHDWKFLHDHYFVSLRFCDQRFRGMEDD